MTVNTCTWSKLKLKKDDYTVISSVHISKIYLYYFNGRVVLLITQTGLLRTIFPDICSTV